MVKLFFHIDYLILKFFNALIIHNFSYNFFLAKQTSCFQFKFRILHDDNRVISKLSLYELGKVFFGVCLSMN